MTHRRANSTLIEPESTKVPGQNLLIGSLVAMFGISLSFQVTPT